MLKAGSACCVYLDGGGGGGGAEDNVCHCETWMADNHRPTSTAAHREGNNALGPLASLSLTS